MYSSMLLDSLNSTWVKSTSICGQVTVCMCSQSMDGPGSLIHIKNGKASSVSCSGSSLLMQDVLSTVYRMQEFFLLPCCHSYTVLFSMELWSCNVLDVYSVMDLLTGSMVSIGSDLKNETGDGMQCMALRHA